MAEAWEEKSPRTEKVVMAASFRSGGPKRTDAMNGGREHTPGLVSEVIHLGSQTLWSLLFGFWAFSYGMEEQTRLHSWTVVWGSLSLGRPMSDAVAKFFCRGSLTVGFPQCREEKVLTIPQAQQDQGCNARESHREKQDAPAAKTVHGDPQEDTGQGRCATG